MVVTAPPYPADQSGNTDSSINRNHPHDWVLAGPGLDVRKEPVVIGTFNDNSVAAKAGLKAGDRIVTIDGKSVDTWDQFSMAIAAKA